MTIIEAANTEPDNGPDDFDAAVDKLTAGMSGTEALRHARRLHPDLYDRPQRAGAVSSRPNFAKADKPDSVAGFEALVDAIAAQ